MEAPSPAPFSTATLAPRPQYFLTVSGDAATRRSPASLSLRTAIFKPPAPSSSPPSILLFADDQYHDERDDDRRDRAPFHQPGERRIGALMDLQFLVGLALGSHNGHSSCSVRRHALARAGGEGQAERGHMRRSRYRS